jgi:hypothetical protein
MQYSHNYPGIKQHSPLDRLTPALQKNQKILNNKQGTEKECAEEGEECPSELTRGRGE